MIRIKSINEFNEYRKNKIGYFLIEDKPTKIKTLHNVSCPHINIRFFEQKVINNQEKNGSYYWCGGFKGIISEEGIRECLVCKK
ncbi:MULTISPECIES: hypothetical protein [unclassified Cytobacillus]|uniref:hypothetical protein n=1 Tax=unclassified Cytobacillus TaxID=2675268 RepID=UPI001357C27F|nr:hypothetical protein [Cytobacillus sp. AMY 15.2]KAF0817644.1 hypothetical protein KIS4809_3461 [Bacillus sp. ZZV12-4809]MCM3092178.1 hypothetical protein [Cytobacillus sp. AMY 15.2]